MNKVLPTDQILMGIHAITEVLNANPDRLIRVFALKKALSSRKSSLLTLCENKGIPIQFLSLDQMTKMTGSDSHQGFAAQVHKRSYLSAKQLLMQLEDREKAVVLMLDQLFDPQNVGAILRSAECFGIQGVIFSKNRGTEITATVTKASCGASEIIPLVRVSNLAETICEFQRHGFTAVASLLNPNAQSLPSYHFPDKTLLIVGSEGEGIQPLIQKRVDESVYIPMKGRIQSLNVAQATTLLLYQATQRD